MGDGYKCLLFAVTVSFLCVMRCSLLWLAGGVALGCFGSHGVAQTRKLVMGGKMRVRLSLHEYAYAGFSLPCRCDDVSIFSLPF